MFSPIMTNPISKSLILLVLLLTLPIQSFNAQVPTVAEDIPIKVKTILLNIPVIVSDSDGRRVAGLRKENFTIFKDGEKQSVEYLLDADVPMNVAILIDTSISTISELDNITDAASDFVALFGSDDKGMIVSADNEIRILQVFTADQKKLRQGIAGTFVGSEPGSNMLDAVHRVVTKDFASLKGRKAIIILSDGIVGGRIYYQETLDALKESDILVYPIYFNKPRILSSNSKTTLAELARKLPMDFLKMMELASGGRSYAANGRKFSAAFQNIADDLKKQYVVGFYPTNSENGNSDNITIEVNVKDVVVRSKSTIRIKTPLLKLEEKPSGKKKK